MPAGSAYCIEEGMITGALHNVDLDGDGVTDHVRFQLRNQFLHPDHPLGWIRRLTVALDGIALRPKDLYFVLRGQWIAAEHLPTISDIWWHMGELAEIYARSTGVTPGSHRVDVAFVLSLQMHTPAIDSGGMWPTLRQALTAHLPAETA